MAGARPQFEGRHLAILVPTKDRPEKMRALLDSLCAQSAACGRVLVIDGGQNVRDVVMRYADRLFVEHHICQPPGKIRQRNMGIALLDERTPLVASLDDDIVLEPGAMAAMIEFWNRAEPDTAGVGFNIVNTPPEPRNIVRDLFLLSGPVPGRVLRSGMTTSNCQIQADLRSEWLCGGATVWRLDIMKAHPHRELPGPWAIAEDIIYSYPIGKRYPLYVCAGAPVRHEHVFDYRVKTPHRFHGKTRALWTFYFVEANTDLSRLAFLWTMFGATLGRLAAGLLTLNRAHLEFALGQVEGVTKGLWALARGEEVAAAIERESKREQRKSVAA